MDVWPVCGEDTKRTVRVLGIDMQVNNACRCRREELEAERKREEQYKLRMRTQELRRR